MRVFGLGARKAQTALLDSGAFASGFCWRLEGVFAPEWGADARSRGLGGLALVRRH